ncbi:MAG: type II toxin-antitoxin system prevent-host-death family antitoxin [Coriobacteriales bacterium]|nr:type II toxin-antitoxin system prevent-host-death family antitoxin [Coriobacteriales bacterium]
MIATNYSNARQNFAHYCKEAAENFETIIVTRKNSQNVVLLSEAEYNNMMENLFVRSNRHDYEQLLKSIAEIKAGKATRHDLVEVD